MKVLVTGGAGYIGSHACKALAASGHQPIVYDNLSEGHRWAVRWGPLEVGDISDFLRLTEVFEKHRPDAVMHFAARAYVGESISDPAKYYNNNVGGTLCLLRAMRQADVARIVFSSTCATYGVPHSIPISEDHPQDPINPYGRSKFMVEQILQDYSRSNDLRAVALRYFNAAGADPDGEIGEAHDPESHLIPIVLKVAAGQEKVVTVFGDDYATSDGTCIRDYTHVSDLAAAHVLALDKIDAGPAFAAYNLGTGSGLSVREIVDLARKITGRDIAIEMGARRPGDPPSLVANAERAKDVLGWQPKLSTAQAMIETAWKWMNRSV